MPFPIRSAALRLLKDPPRAPAFVLYVSYIGFGALCQSVNFDLAPAAFTTLFIFALPAQVIFVDQFARGAPVFAAGIAVTFTAVRLLPMTVALMPYLKFEPKRRWIAYIAAHFIAVTVWIESMRRLPSVPEALRVAYFFCLAVGLISISLLGTCTGFLLAQYLSKTVSAALILLTPVYFFLGLLGPKRALADIAPLAGGFLAAPLFMYLSPGFDLALAGLSVGTANFLLLRRRRSRSRATAAALPAKAQVYDHEG
jgi:predicted branched-subunit amino acid permease